MIDKHNVRLKNGSQPKIQFGGVDKIALSSPLCLAKNFLLVDSSSCQVVRGYASVKHLFSDAPSCQLCQSKHTLHLVKSAPRL